MKKVKKMLKYNFKTLVGFEFIYKLLSVIIFGPIFLSLFKLTTILTGYSYLTFENVFDYLLNPITIIFLLILILIMTFYTIIDISTIIIVLDCSYNSKKITIKDAFILAWRKTLKLFSKRTILLPFLVIFLIPFLNIGISSSFISTIKIPEFIMDFITHNKLLVTIYILVILLLAFIMFKWLYAIHYVILEDYSFKDARKKSANLSKNNKLKDFLSINIIQFLIAIFYVLFVFVGILLIILIYKMTNLNIFGNLFITVIWQLIMFSLLIIALLATPLSFASISALFYLHKEKIKEKTVPLKIKEKEINQTKKKLPIFKMAVSLLIILSGTLFTYSIINGEYDFNIEYVRTMDVTAHRGLSVKYPENTMSAFKGAKEAGADWIELDVQQTKDKELIILHDTNLKRTTGLDKNTWEVNLDEVKKLDAGSFFSKEFKDERIPTLEEVVSFASLNNIKLNIELKPTGHETDFEASVIDVVKKYHLEKDAVITSQVYEVLENVKKVDKNIKTVYVTSFAYGDITKLDKADSFSVEASSVNKVLVSNVHNAGKSLYAWTVNTKENILKMAKLNVDNIITDNVTLAKDTIYTSKTSNIVEEYIELIRNLFY